MGRPNKHRPPPEHADRSTWYRRHEVAKLVQLTREGVRHLETNNTLHPVLIDGEWRFDPFEIDRYVKARADRLTDNTQTRLFKRGEIAAHAFAMFGEGKTRREVVLKLKIEPEYAQRLWEQYQPETFEEAEKAKAARKSEAEREARQTERRERMKEMLGKLGTK